MTTVAAVARAGWVWMAADSCNNVHDRPIVGSAQKITRKVIDGRPVLFGVCGAGALAQLTARRLQLPHLPTFADWQTDAPLQAWAHDAASAVTDMARGHGITRDSGVIDGTLLMGFAGRLWTITDHQAIPQPDGIAAIGSGDELAIGALHALIDEVDAAWAVRRALEIACAHDRYSDRPIQFERLEPLADAASA